jgi:hypothetical protein
VIVPDPVLLTHEVEAAEPLPQSRQITYRPEEPFGENPIGDEPETEE